MANEVQISAFVSKSTRDLLEQESKSTGVKKAHLIEQALLHHFNAIHTIPAEYIIPPRITVPKESAKEFLKLLKGRNPSPRLKRLMRDGN